MTASRLNNPVPHWSETPARIPNRRPPFRLNCACHGGGRRAYRRHYLDKAQVEPYNRTAIRASVRFTVQHQPQVGFTQVKFRQNCPAAFRQNA